jgi:hypothetical protein
MKLEIDWVFQTGCEAPGFTRNDWGTSRPCLFPPMAVKSKPPGESKYLTMKFTEKKGVTY